MGWAGKAQPPKLIKMEDRTDNTVIINLDKQKWGRGHNVIEAMDNAKATKRTRMLLYVFPNDSWDILGDGRVTWPKESSPLIQQRLNID